MKFFLRKESVFIVNLLLLAGCASPSSIVSDLTCLTGVCQSSEERLLSIQWAPSELEKKGCNISGKYQAWGYVSTKVKQNQENLFNYLDYQLHRDNKNLREMGMQVSYEVYHPIPSKLMEYTTLYKPIEKENGRYISKPSREKIIVRHDESDFYTHAKVVINQTNETIESSLIGENGNTYRKSVLNFNHHQIGCNDKYLVIRQISGSYGSEGAEYGAAVAREIRYLKRSDGYLELTVYSREWLLSLSRGLVGLSADGQAVAGAEPRVSNYTLIFYPAQ